MNIGIYTVQYKIIIILKGFPHAEGLKLIAPPSVIVQNRTWSPGSRTVDIVLTTFPDGKWKEGRQPYNIN